MLLDGLILVEGSTASNLVIASGSSFPSSADLGELFYRSDLSQLSIYNGSTWTNVSSVGGLGTVTSLGISSSDLAVSGSPVTSSGTITLSLNTIPISKGGTGATTTATAINNLLPAQTANSQKFLKTDGTNVSWGVVTTATVYVGTSTGDVSAVEGNAFYADGTGDSAEGLHVYSGGNWIQVTGAGSIPSGLFSADVEGDVTGTIVGGDTATLTLATSGVVAGTYTKVTVDEKGRVTTATTLDAGDIPSLAGTYLTGNETISLSGDATGSGSTSIAVTLANSGAVAGTYTKVTVDAKGRVTTATSLSAGDIPSLSSTYQPLDADLTAIAGLAGTSGALKKTAANTWSLDTSTYLTGNQTVTVSGDASGSGSTAISLTLANSGVAAGTYGTASAVPTVTVDAKGRLTSATATNIAIAASQITSGTLSDARVAASNVTQHQASLTIAETQITDGALLARVGSSETISGTWTFNSPVTVGTPVSGSHAATKDYVDNTITGLDMKASVRVATTGNITLSGTQTIDGVAVIAGNRVLVKDQTVAADNGIYVVAAGSWSRASDADNTPAGEVTSGMYTFVEEGTTNADSGWVLSTNNPISLGTTTLTFVQFNGLGQVTAGAGLTKTGNTMNVVSASADRVIVNADSIDLASTGTAGTYAKVTTDAYGRVVSGGALSAGDIPSLSSTYQPLDADLTAIAGLAGTSGLLKKTGADSWSLDTSTYLTGNESISVSGDATGSGSTSIALTLANSGVVAGSYTKVTVDAKGRVTTATSLTAGDIPSLASTYVLKAGDTVTGTLTGTNFHAGAGTTSSPSISFSADTNTGIYSPSADSIAFVEGGTEVMRIDSAGNMGIGTVSPTPGYKLHVAGSITATSIALGSAVSVGPTGSYILQNAWTTSSGNLVLKNGTDFGKGNEFQLGYFPSPNDGSEAWLMMYGSSSATLHMAVTDGNMMVGTTAHGGNRLTVSGTATTTALRIGSGSTSSPSLSFLDDFATGIFKPTTTTLGFSTNGGERMRIDSTGNVGIGTTSPVAKFQVNLGAEGEYMRVGGDNASGGRALRFSSTQSGVSPGAFHTINAASGEGQIALATGSTERMRIDSTGNIGIGTSTFTHRLAVYGGDINLMQNATYVRSATTAGTSVRMLGINASNTAYVGPIDGGPVATFYSAGATSLVSAFYTGGTERMRIDANGNLGIGTSTVAAKLHVVGNISRFGPITSATSQLHLVNNNTDLSTTTSFIIGLDSGAAANFGSAYAGVIWHQQAYPILFATNNIPRMRITADGNVGIGTTSTIGRLDVAGDTNIRGTVTATTASITSFLVGDGTVAAPSMSFSADTDTGIYRPSANTLGFVEGGAEAMRIDSSGNLAIGTMTNSLGHRLMVHGASSGGIGGLGSSYLLSVKSTATSSYLGFNQSAIATAGADPLQFGTVNAERMRISTSGNLALGTTLTETFLNEFSASSQGLTVASGLPTIALVDTEDSANYRSWIANVSGSLYISNKSSTGTLIINNAGSERMRITSAGNVGIGTSTVTAKLTVNGDALINGVTVGMGTNSGDGNVAVGTSALAANALGTDNTAVGRNALVTNSGGYRNSAVGSYALEGNTNGYGNSALGYQALLRNSTGDNNTAVGNGALLQNTSAADNTAVGAIALRENTVGTANVAVGSGALNSNTSGSYLVAVGAEALFSNSIGSYNIAVGADALRANTTGLQNVAQGYQALYSNTSGSNNAAHGHQALYSNTSGSNNAAQGYQALFSNTTGIENSAFGRGALLYNTSGSFNIAVGADALRANTTGTLNVAVGVDALYSNTAGSHNIAIGRSALHSNVTAGSNIAVGGFALYDNTTGFYNIALGQQVLRFNTSGHSNIAIGRNALLYNTSGSYNVAVGVDALTTNTSGLYNSALGYQALYLNTTGEFNAAHGFRALYSNITGSFNVGVGAQALFRNTTGTANVAVGLNTLRENVSGSYNSALGNEALYSNATGDSNVAQGSGALRFNVDGNDNAAIGRNALYSNTSGSWNIAIGRNALFSNTTGTNNVSVGHQALFSNTIGADNVAIGRSALYSSTSTSFNVAIGRDSLFTNTTGTYNVAVGYYSLRANTSGDSNVAVGHQALVNNTTGRRNNAQGFQALYNNTSGSNNVAIGNVALFANTTGIENSAVGYQALSSNTSGNSNNAFGKNALFSNTTGTANVAVGNDALFSNTSGSNNVAQGHQALYSNTSGTSNTANGVNALRSNTTGNSNTANGLNALFSNVSGSKNTANGVNALFNNTTGDSNSAFGHEALYNNTTGTFNVAVGSAALFLNTVGSGNIAQGYQALYNNTTGDDNVAIGRGALLTNTSSSYNTAIGRDSLLLNNTGTFNTAVGYHSLRVNTTGSNCVAVGAYALPSNKTGYGNTAVGANAMQANTTGENNVAVGHLSMYANTTGNQNIAVGRSALYGNTTGYDNAALGWTAMLGNTVGYQNIGLGTRSLQTNTSGYRLTALGVDALRLNTSGHSSAAVGYGALASNTTGAENVAVGRNALNANTSGSWNVGVGYFSLFNSSGTNNFSIGAFSGADALLNITTASNQGVIGNNSTTNITAKVAITVPSDIRDKTEIAPVTLGLGFVNSVNPISYRFKKSRDSEEAVGRKILGFSAQELLPLQGDATIIDASDANLLKFNSHDLIAVLFKAVKELSTEIEILKAKIDNKE